MPGKEDVEKKASVMAEKLKQDLDLLPHPR